MSRVIATFGYVGLLPRAPGTFGSLAALPLAWLLHWAGGFPLFLGATLLVFVVGLWAAGREIAGDGKSDPPEIVVDEVVGQWIALFPLSAGLWMQGMPGYVFPYPGWIGAFVMFRLFDICKPWPVSWADRRPGAIGIMLDDVIAGAIAAFLLAFTAAVAHGALM